MSLERILTDYGEPLQYLVYFGLLAGLGAVEARPDAAGGGQRTSG
jgi:hypothetical protein